MKRIIAFLLLSCVLFSLVACGDAGEDAGKYVCVRKQQGEEILAPDGEWLLLEGNGKGSIKLDLELDLSWKQKDECIINIETEFIENKYTAILTDDELTLETNGILYIFVKEGQEKAWRLKQAEIDAENAMLDTQIDPAVIGHYSCVSAIQGEVTIPPEGKWLDLFEDGSATAYFSMSLPGIWASRDGKLTLSLNNGEVYTGMVEGNSITLNGEIIYTMSRTGEAGSINAETDLATPTMLVVGSKWSGELKIRRHIGRGDLHDGKFKVIGELVERGGNHFFEVHYADEPNADPIVCVQVAIHKSNLEPMLGEGTARSWVFSYDLVETDSFTLTMFLDSENELEFYHEYKSWTESCDLYFSFYPDMGE